METCLLAANKQDPETLKEGETMQAMLDGTEGTMIPSVDAGNCYNEIMRSTILEYVWECTELR
eukprot:2351757-Ditylum_brightwellii.AAC.1